MQAARRFLSVGIFKFSCNRIHSFQSPLSISFQLSVCPVWRVNCQSYRPRGPRRFTSLRFRRLKPSRGPVQLVHTDNGTMKLDTPEFRACFTPQLIKLANIFTRHGYELRIAGGAVRDMLMGGTPHDIDFATNATPDQMKAMFAQENVRTFNEKGEKHGTVSVRMDGKENFEITTLRIDIVTDGRHAEVQYTQDWLVDANRRDLTVNSMFLGLDGTLYDYFNGHEDLKKGVCSFVGDADSRIKEDYLRILRYFRFFGRICKDPHAHKEDVLDAIKKNLEGLNRISGERVWMEVNKLLKGAFSKELMLTMLDVGLGPYIGLPKKEKLNIREFERVSLLTAKGTIEPIVRIASLLHTEEEVLDFHKRCKLSAVERDLGLFILKHRDDIPDPAHPLRIYQRMLLFAKMKGTTMRDYINQLLIYQNKFGLMTPFRSWRLNPFPLNGNVLRAYGVTENGRELGRLIESMKVYWLEQDFKPGRNDLLRYLPIRMEELGMAPVTLRSASPSPPRDNVGTNNV